MLKIDVLSLFPEMFNGILNESIVKRAIDKKLVEVNIINFRSFSKLNNNQVDDTPYGGGGGMVLMCEPIYDAILSLKKENSHVILLTPDGKTYNQSKAVSLKDYEHLIIICGHYEGFDERIRSFVHEEISIGDYVLTGGEIGAMVLIDSIARLIPGVITETSLESESFSDNLLDYPNWTKPREFRGMKVPDVLLSGNHTEIAKFREKMRIEKTKEKRPDLLK